MQNKTSGHLTRIALNLLLFADAVIVLGCSAARPQAQPPSPATSVPPIGKIAYVCGQGDNSEICVINSDGSPQQRLTTSPGEDALPSWSADGTRVAFQSNRDGNREIYVMKADGSQPTRLTNSAADELSPAWSPDGGAASNARIAFESTRDRTVAKDTNHQIYVMNADGSNIVNLSNNVFDDAFPRWSPDGKQIVFQSSRSGHWGIYVMNADGSNATRLTDREDDTPAWSPDGKFIAFESLRAGSYDLYVIGADGSHEQRLTTNLAADRFPAWSPDGAWIVYSSNLTGGGGAFTGPRGIFIMRADGSQQRRLTEDGGTFPVWQPISHP